VVAASESSKPAPAQFKVGKRNLITDVDGILVGHAHDQNAKTGTTVVTSSEPFIASVDVMGGAPGTRETDCLAPDKLVDRVDALVLSGGSAFGLEAASAVANELGKKGKGFPVGNINIPIVPAAILFDFFNGGDVAASGELYRTLGVSALDTAAQDFVLGTAGAGYGATTADYKGGIGSTSLVLPDGSTVGALVAANPHGSAVVPGCGQFWASPFEVGDEFGGLGVAAPEMPLAVPENQKVKAFEALARRRGEFMGDAPTDSPMNTTIAIVATDVALSKAQLKRMAVAAQDGLARAIVPAHTAYDGDLIFSVSTARAVVPAHTAYDGDLIFSVSTAKRELAEPIADVMLLGHAAALCLSRAIARAVFEALTDRERELQGSHVLLQANTSEWHHSTHCWPQPVQNLITQTRGQSPLQVPLELHALLVQLDSPVHFDSVVQVRSALAGRHHEFDSGQMLQCLASRSELCCLEKMSRDLQQW